MSISERQYKLKILLKKVFPNFYFEEEYQATDRLRLDFFCKKLRLALEYDGPQHEEFIPFFHENEEGFREQLERDSRKERWCKLNDITLVRIKEEDLNEEALRRKINEALGESDGNNK